jgi:hypothetical protein
MPVDSRISPHFSDEKYKTGSLDDLIDILEDRVKFWLLAPAKALLELPFGDAAVLSLLLGYFEAHAVYRKGEDSTNKSKVFFRAGFIEVFRKSGLDEALLGRVADLLYVSARCGLFHEGMVREGIYIGAGAGELSVTVPRVNGKPDVNGPVESVMIDVAKFYVAVERHFSLYVRSLRNASNIELRDNFKRAVELRWTIQEPGRAIGMSEEEFLKRRV